MTLDEPKSKVVEFKIIWSSSTDCLKYKSYFSIPEFIEFPTAIPGQTAYAYFYPPANPSYQAGQEEKPPLLLQSHGTKISMNNLYYVLQPIKACVRYIGHYAISSLSIFRLMKSSAFR